MLSFFILSSSHPAQIDFYQIADGILFPVSVFFLPTFCLFCFCFVFSISCAGRGGRNEHLLYQVIIRFTELVVVIILTPRFIQKYSGRTFNEEFSLWRLFSSAGNLKSFM